MTERADEVTGEPHDLVAGFLLDALEGPERSRFVDHLPSCAACQGELRALAPAVADLASTVEVVPPPALETALMGALFRDALHESDRRVGATAPASGRLDGVVGGMPGDPRGGRSSDPRRRSRWMWPAAAAAAFVLGVGVAASTHPFGTAPTDQQVAEAAEMHQIMQVTAAPDAHLMPLEVPGATTRLVLSNEMDMGAVLASDLPMPANGREYHLWSKVDDGAMKSAATFVPDQSGHVSTMLDTGVRSATAFMLTIEEPGAQNPTSPPIAEVTT